LIFRLSTWKESETGKEASTQRKSKNIEQERGGKFETKDVFENKTVAGVFGPLSFFRSCIMLTTEEKEKIADCVHHWT